MSQSKYKVGDVVGIWYVKQVEKFHKGEWLYSITSMNTYLGFGGIPESELDESAGKNVTPRHSVAEVESYLTRNDLW